MLLHNATVQISMELWGAIICLIFAAFIFIGETKSSRWGRIMMALLLLMFVLLVSDSAAWFYRSKPGTVAYWAVRISNYLVFALNYAIGYVFMLDLEVLLAAKNERLAPWFRRCMIGVCLTGFLLVTISQFTGFLYTFDETNTYHRAGGYLVICAVALVMVLMMIGAASYYHLKKHLKSVAPLLTVFVLVLLATIIQTLLYGISLVNLAMTVGVLIMFFSYEKERAALSSERRERLLENGLNLMKQKAMLAQKDAEMARINTQLLEERTQIMLSQIQPHFIYNALSAISFLCIKDPAKAKETIDNFAIYLRTNLNSLKTDHLVSFEQELQHTKAYLFIEKTRFGDDLRIQYDIGPADFILPSLSLQPLAENAVRHGICGREDGGTLTIRTERKNGNIIISVIDDGIGFDATVKPQDGKVHVGMENVIQRVRTLCGGDVVIDSAPGFGTTATISLPDQK